MAAGTGFAACAWTGVVVQMNARQHPVVSVLKMSLFNIGKRRIGKGKVSWL
jgi:hypothetical protein